MRADRVFFAPGELGLAFNGDESQAIGASPMLPSTLVSAVTELLSQDEIRDLPNSRPRIVRHEHDGVDYVVEVTRQSGGIAIGVRLAKTTLRRDPSESPRGSLRDSTRKAQPAQPLLEAREPSLPPPPPTREPPTRALPLLEAATPTREVPAVTRPDDGPARRGSKRLRAAKRTVRVEVDDEGVPLDATAIDLDMQLPDEPGKFARRTSKPFKRPVIPDAPAPTPAGERVYETRVIPRAGRPTTDAEILGAPLGAHVTFLFAPSGFSLVTSDGAVVLGPSDITAIAGELYVGPSMKLRIAQGPKESIVTFYRRR